MPFKVLVADDEVPIVRIAQMNLRRRGFEVITAYDGREALEKVRSERPDVIVLDVMMPHMDGFAVLERLKENPDMREIPVIMLTVRAQDADIAHGEESGAARYVTKPFNPLDLIALIEEVLGQDTS
jgi:two-component system alkaline phosphatase synthesis response regulator PhoP